MLKILIPRLLASIFLNSEVSEIQSDIIELKDDIKELRKQQNSQNAIQIRRKLLRNARRKRNNLILKSVFE